jgi:hypothetical protein
MGMEMAMDKERVRGKARDKVDERGTDKVRDSFFLTMLSYYPYYHYYPYYP